MKVRSALLIGLVGAVILAGCATAPTPTAEPTSAPTSPPPRDEIYMAEDGSGNYPALEQALAAANPGATITLGPGTYRVIQALDIGKSIRLVGAGMEETEIVSGAPGYLLTFNGSGSFAAKGITFQHDGTQLADVVVIESGSVDLVDCRFTGAVYEEGKGNRAGLRFRGGAGGTVENCVVSGNDNTGILVEQQAAPELRGNTCSNNGVVGIGYTDLAGGLAIENECTGNSIGIGVAVKSQPTLERNRCNDNEYGIAYVENGGGESRGNECSGNKVGIAVGDGSTVALSDNDCRDNAEEDIRDLR